MIIDEDVYLEHFGVKGQKWGVRRKQQSTPASRKSRKKRIAIGAGAAAILIGAGVAAVLLNQHGGATYSGIKVSSMTPAARDAAFREIERTLNLSTTTSWNAIKASEAAGHISAADSARLRQEGMNAMRRQLRDASRDLR